MSRALGLMTLLIRSQRNEQNDHGSPQGPGLPAQPHVTRRSSRMFLLAALYGVAILLPQYFMEAQISRWLPPAISHPEQYYGFIGIALAWQLVFFLIASDVIRFRVLMLPAIMEKLAFGVPAILLFCLDRTHAMVAGAGAVDILLAVGFLWAYRSTRPSRMSHAVF